MAKLGTYGIIRFDLNLFPQASRTLAPLLLTLAVIGIVYGALVACAQRDLKRLLAYSSLAQIGFIALGTFALNSQGLSGGVLQMVNHGLVIATLFILVGWIYERRRTWQIGSLKGLQSPAPVLAGVFTVAMLASIGVPGLNGFVGEFLILIGTFVAHRWWAVVGHRRGGDRRRVPPLGLPAGLPRRARPARTVGHPGPVAQRAPHRGPADRPDRAARRVPEAGARPDHPVGRPAGRSTSTRSPTPRSRPTCAVRRWSAVRTPSGTLGGPGPTGGTGGRFDDDRSWPPRPRPPSTSPTSTT